MRMLGIGFVIAASIPAAVPAQAAAPTVRIADPRSLDGLFEFGSLPATAGGQSRGTVAWRINIDLPTGAILDRVVVPFLEPPVLHLKDGRCFRIEFDQDRSRSSHLSAARIAEIDCPPERRLVDPDLRPIARQNLTYVGRAWDVDAYADARTATTVLFQDLQKDPVPLLTTGMRVMALGGMGSPDTGSTEIRLIGMVGGQLTLVGIYLNVAYA